MDTHPEHRKVTVSEIEIRPIKPKKGLVALASCLVTGGEFYANSIGIMTVLRKEGGYRILWPTKKVGDVYHCDACDNELATMFQTKMDNVTCCGKPMRMVSKMISIPIFHPIRSDVGLQVKDAIIAEYQKCVDRML